MALERILRDTRRLAASSLGSLTMQNGDLELISLKISRFNDLS